MGDLLIRNIPEQIERDITARAERNGTSVSDEAKNILSQAIGVEELGGRTSGAMSYQAIRAAFASEGALGDEFATIMEEVEAERKADFGRPIADVE